MSSGTGYTGTKHVRTRPQSKNILASSPHYIEILKSYNEWYERDGRVNRKEFHKKVILKLLPDYSVTAWYGFIGRYESRIKNIIVEKEAVTSIVEQEGKLEKGILNNQNATAIGINTALNMGAQYLAVLHKKFIENPDSLTTQENKVLSEAMYKAMKSQDSRINAIGKIREDNRQEEQMQHAFDNAQYE